MENPWGMMWEQTPESIDQDASNRTNKLDPGYYRVVVKSSEMDDKDGSQKFRFDVTYGPNAGRVHFESIDNPRFAENEKAATTRANIAKTWASRLQCIPAGTLGAAAPEWARTVGKEMIIKITVRKWTSADKTKSGESHEIGWSGLWPLDHPDIAKLKNDVRATIGLPPIAGNDPKSPPPSSASSPINPGPSPVSPATSAPAPAAVTPESMAASLWN